MNFSRSIAHNTLSQVASRVILSGTSFLVTMVVARFFGLSLYGDIAKIIGFGSLFYVGIDLGMNAIFLRLKDVEQEFDSLLALRLLIAACLFAVSFLVVLMLPYNAYLSTGYSLLVKVGIILFSFSFFSRAIVFSCAALFQKKLLYQQTTAASFFSSLTTLSIVVLAITLHIHYLWIIAAYVIGGFIEAAVSLFFVRERFTFFFKKHIAKNLLIQSLPLTMLLVINLIYFRVDILLLSLLKKSADVGVYDFAYRFFDFFIALPLFLSNSLYPNLLEQEKNNRNQVKNISLYVLFFIFLGTVLVPIIWIASPLLSLVKQEFAPSAAALRVLTFSLPVFFATSILQWILIAKKREKFLLFVYAVSFVGNVILNVLFIPQYSYMASAIITGVSEAGVFILFLWYFLFKL